MSRQLYKKLQEIEYSIDDEDRLALSTKFDSLNMPRLNIPLMMKIV